MREEWMANIGSVASRLVQCVVDLLDPEVRDRHVEDALALREGRLEGLEAIEDLLYHLTARPRAYERRGEEERKRGGEEKR